MAQREVDHGLKLANQWILQLLDLLLLKRELGVFISQTTVQGARIESIIRECSATSIIPKESACEKLTSLLDVSLDHKSHQVQTFRCSDETSSQLTPHLLIPINPN